MVKSDFRKYTSWEQSIKDNATFYTSTDHRKNVYADAINGKTYKDEAYGLTGPGRYATDPNYAKYLIEVVGKYNLTQYNKNNTEAKGVVKLTAIDISKHFMRN